jgi:hypothetical protein
MGVSTAKAGKSMRVLANRASIQGVPRMEANEYKTEAGIDKIAGQREV